MLALFDNPERIRLYIEVEAVYIPVDTAVPLGLVADELITRRHIRLCAAVAAKSPPTTSSHPSTLPPIKQNAKA